MFYSFIWEMKQQISVSTWVHLCQQVVIYIYLKYILWFMFYERISDGSWFIESHKILWNKIYKQDTNKVHHSNIIGKLEIADFCTNLALYIILSNDFQWSSLYLCRFTAAYTIQFPREILNFFPRKSNISNFSINHSMLNIYPFLCTTTFLCTMQK